MLLPKKPCKIPFSKWSNWWPWLVDNSIIDMPIFGYPDDARILQNSGRFIKLTTTVGGLQTSYLLWSGLLESNWCLGIFRNIPMYGPGIVFAPLLVFPRQAHISSQLHLIFSKQEATGKMGKQPDVPNAGLRQTDPHDGCRELWMSCRNSVISAVLKCCSLSPAVGVPASVCSCSLCLCFCVSSFLSGFIMQCVSLLLIKGLLYISVDALLLRSICLYPASFQKGLTMVMN